MRYEIHQKFKKLKFTNKYTLSTDNSLLHQQIMKMFIKIPQFYQ